MACTRRKTADGAGADRSVLTTRWRWLRVLGRVASLVLFALCAAIVLTSKPADPSLWPAKPGANTTRVLLISNGFHSGIVLPRAALEQVAVRNDNPALRDVAQRFGAYGFLEFGWGEERFYRNTPTIASIDPVLAMRALFWPFTQSVVHVVGLDEPPENYFARAEQMPIDLSYDGFARLVARLDASLQRGPDGEAVEAGRGLYGPSLFYRATDHFSIAKTCNRWIGELIAAAGLPSSPILSLVSPIFFPSLRNAMRRVT